MRGAVWVLAAQKSISSSLFHVDAQYLHVGIGSSAESPRVRVGWSSRVDGRKRRSIALIICTGKQPMESKPDVVCWGTATREKVNYFGTLFKR
jgi:hypothetical protein